MTEAAAILAELLERVEARNQPPPRRGTEYYIRRNAHRTYLRHVHGRRICT